MNLNPKHHPVPESLQTPNFVIRHQQPSDNAPDYEAVMDSKELLREWSDSPWPKDDFTLEQNAEDIAEHIEEHAHDLSYGFSIFTPDYSRLLGSLYLNPLEPLLEHYPADPQMLATLRTFDIRVEYWLRRGTAVELEKAFVQEVMTWLRCDWWFTNPVFGSRKGMTERRKLYSELGMVEVAALWNQDKTRRFHFHRPTPVDPDTL
jgi:RimJ/RimL family protein N-acetyltransferase